MPLLSMHLAGFPLGSAVGWDGVSEPGQVLAGSSLTCGLWCEFGETPVIVRTLLFQVGGCLVLPS